MTGGRNGFTLIELVAAIGIFALVAVMGLQALTMGIRAETGLDAAAAEDAALFRTLALLRRDLAAAVPVPFQPPLGAAEAPWTAPAGGNRLAVSVAGQPRLPGSAEAGLGRVEWRLDAATGVLYRRFWPMLAPREAAGAGPELAMLAGVESLALDEFPPGAEPRENPFDAGEAPPAQLPQGFEVRLRTTRHGTLRLVVAP
ncbi:MAG: prepilin-type N-terminal cleavage/methylation domain-containing protein [Rhodobacteraceae bacterium]|jgi:general secretion pathway protein J|nr:prepilin-type N-terminal cleavage/methylation domain-containing protein [Paracoccaceae bacterium]